MISNRVRGQFLYFIVGFAFFLIDLSLAGARVSDKDHHLTHDPNKEIGSPFIKNYTPKEYKAHAQNSAVVQDHRGVMYFANTSGVLEFDGSSWRLIPVSNGSLVRSLEIGSDGAVYVGAVGEIGYLASDSNGKMQYVSLVQTIPEEHRNFGDVFLTHSSDQGIYFIARNIIFRFFGNKMETIRSDRIGRFYPLPVNGSLFIRDDNLENNKNLYRLEGNMFDQIPLPASVAEQGIMNFLPYSKDKLLVVTSSGKFYIYDPKVAKKSPQKKDSPEVCKRLHAEIEEYLKRNQVDTGAQKHGDRYVFNTFRGGVVIMDAEGKLVRVINKNRGLLSDWVTHVFIDRDGNLWAAFNKGIAHIEISSPLSIYNALSGLDTIVLGYMRAYGKLYVSGFGGVHVLSDYALSVENDRTEFVPVQNFPRMQTFFITKMYEKLYAFPYGAGIFQIDELGARLISKNELPVVKSSCRSKKFPNHVFLGLGSFGLGAVEFDPSTRKVKRIHFNTGNFAKLKDTVQFVYSDEQGDIWLAAYSGVYQAHFTGESVTDFELIHHDTKGMNIAPTTLRIIDGQIVVSEIALSDGLYKLVPDANKKTGFTFVPASSIGTSRVENHTQINWAYGLGKGTIIAKTESGHAMLRKGADGHYHWDANSLKKVEGWTHKAYVESDGTVWIGSNEDLYRYDPRVKKDYATDYPCPHAQCDRW